MKRRFQYLPIGTLGLTLVLEEERLWLDLPKRGRRERENEDTKISKQIYAVCQIILFPLNAVSTLNTH
jgi:hypothetical protein